MQNSFSILFYLKKPKIYSSGPAPIYLRITVNGKRSEISISREINPDKWNSEAGRVIGNNENAKALNVYLDTLKNKVYDAQRKLIDAGEIITAENLKNKFTGKSEKSRNLIPIFQDHNRKIAALINTEYAPNTIKRYETSLNHTIEFLRWKYNVSDIDIRKIDHAFIAEYEFYLRSECKCNNNSAVKYIRNFGKVIRICIANGWIDKNPFANYKTKVREVERIFLTEEEIQTMITKEFVIERVSQVRDIFLFCCYTGLAYIDVKQLTSTNVSIGIDGERWIFTNRQKTDTRTNIPLLPMAQRILNKYKNHPQCVNENRLLPVLSNQKMNSYLKEIADLCGIQKELTFHIARHTFATTVTLTNGVSMESVSKMLGHKNMRTTQHYAKILDRKVSDDMRLLKERLSRDKIVKEDYKTGS
jgi:site-specific recombinase XerD